VAARVLFVTNLLTHYRRPLYEELGRRLRVRYVFFSDGGETYWQGGVATSADIVSVSPRGVWVGRTRIVPGLVAEVLARPYDVVVTSLVGKFALAVSYLGARLRRRPVVLWATLWAHPDTPFHRRTRRVTEWLYRDADAVVTYGRHVSRHVVDAGADPDRVFVAPQAVDLTLFTPGPARPDNGPLRIGYVGRLEPEKGVPDLLAAVARMTQEHELVVVGEGSVAVPGARGRVPNDALPDVYRDIDVVVVPSVATAAFSEPWSLVVNEALGCGTAVVASTAVGAVQDGLVSDGETGLVFEAGDTAALAGALDRLAADRALLRRLAAAGHAAVQEYTYERAADAFVAAVQAACNRRERRALRTNRAFPTK
jgi:glycosyltransferase involved in cell wall biosynthesis